MALSLRLERQRTDTRTVKLATGLRSHRSRKRRELRISLRLSIAVAISFAALMAPVASASASTGSASALGVKVTPSSNSVSARLDALRDINYFPSAHSWAGMWTDWDARTVASDLARIKALGGNAVRVTVPTATFGYPRPSATMQQRLAQFAALAHADGIKIQLAIFDGFTSWSDIEGSKVWASQLLAPYANRSDVAFVDLRNELDPSDARQLAWAKRLLPYAEHLMGSVLVTVSKSGGGGAAALCAFKAELAPAAPTFWDWHYYGVEGLAFPFFAQAKSCLAPDPLLIGETGQSTYPDGSINALPVSSASYQAYQAYYLRTIETAAAAAGLPAVAPWMLTDLDPAGAPPQPTAREYYYGVYSANGVAKPAAATLAAYFGGRPVGQDFDGSFEQTIPSDSGQLLPALWRTFDPTGGRISSDTTVSHSGHASLRMSGTSGNSSQMPGMWVVPVDAGVKPGGLVAASVWAKGTVSTGVNQLSVSFFDANGVYVGQVSSKALSRSSTNWTLLTAEGHAPPKAAYVRIYLKSGNNSGTVWFDDVTYLAPTGLPSVGAVIAK